MACDEKPFCLAQLFSPLELEMNSSYKGQFSSSLELGDSNTETERRHGEVRILGEDGYS